METERQSMKKGLSPPKWGAAHAVQCFTHLKLLIAFQMEMSITEML